MTDAERLDVLRRGAIIWAHGHDEALQAIGNDIGWLLSKFDAAIQTLAQKDAEIEWLRSVVVYYENLYSGVYMGDL